MNLQVTRRLVAGLSLIAFSAACSGASNSLSPTGPSRVVAANSAAAVTFSPNPDETPVCKEGEVLNPLTGLCEVPTPECKEGEVLNPLTGVCEIPPPPGVGCSPGYWKNHVSEFTAACGAAAAVTGDRFLTCNDLWTALKCKGSDASCGRNEAAGVLNGVTGCTED